VIGTHRLWFGLGLALGLAGQACNKGVPVRQGAVEVFPAKLDLGVLNQNQSAQRSVELRILGGSAARLTMSASSTRCRWQGLPEQLAAGASAVLSVTCQSDLMGPLREHLVLMDTDRGRVAATVEIAGTIAPLIAFDTSFLDLRPEFGQARSAEVHLVGAHAHQVHPRVSNTGSDLVTVTPLDADAGGVPGFRVSCRGSRVGIHAGSLTIETGLAEPPSLTLSWGCRVPATLQVEPSNPYFNLHVSGDRALTITVRSTHHPFTVKSARVTEGPFAATVETQNPDGSIPITIRVKNQEIPDDARSAVGKLIIQSNDPREPSKEVPLFGSGKINKVTAHP
jgi:hypothetical protein